MNPYAPQQLDASDAMIPNIVCRATPWRIATLAAIIGVCLWCVYWALSIYIEGTQSLLGNPFFARHVAVSSLGFIAALMFYRRQLAFLVTAGWSAIAILLIGQMALPGLLFGEWDTLLTFYGAPLFVALFATFSAWRSLHATHTRLDQALNDG